MTAAKDIGDQAFLDAVAQCNLAYCRYPVGHFSGDESRGHWANWMDLAAYRFPEYPAKVVLAKARQLIKRKLLSGCACGCRGDFELTDRGWEAVK